MATQEVLDGQLVEPLDQSDPDLNAAWWSFRDEIEKEQNSSGTIVVFEVPLDATGIVRGRTLRNIRLFSVTVGTLTMDDICDRIIDGFMNPGERKTFKLMGHIEGQRGVKLNKFISLAKPMNVKALGHDSELATVMNKMLEAQARDRAEMRAMLSEIMATRSTPQVDPLQFGMQMAEKLTALAASLNGPRHVETLSGQPPGSMVEQMTQMMTMMTMAKKMFGGEAANNSGDGDQSFASILKDVLAVAKPLIAASAAGAQQRLPAPQASQTPRVTAPVAAESVAPPAQENVTGVAGPERVADPFAKKKEENEMRLLQELKAALPTFIELAARDAPVKDCAQLALSSMPDSQELNDTLFGFLNDPDFFKRLTMLEPAVAPHAQWFEKFRQALLVEFEPDAPAANADANAGQTE